MKFRRSRAAFIGGPLLIFGTILMFVLQVYIMDFNMWLSLTAVVSGITGLLICIYMDNEYINIDEKGITCRKKNVLLWSFAWDEIEALKLMRGSFPKVYVVLKSSDDNVVTLEEKGLYFEYRHIAKKALGKYCSKSEKSGWYESQYIRKTDV